MKYIPLLLLLLLSTTLQAKKVMRIRAPYTIISDNIAPDVPYGFCRIKGSISDQGNSYNAGIVSNYDMTRKTKVDSLGTYSLLIPVSDSIVFFYALGKEEVIIKPYDFKSGHEVVINFHTISNIEMMIVDKPVIYCYSETAIPVKLNIDFKGDLKFTYPAYNNGWNVLLDEKGIEDLESKKTYPYLFWEGEMPTLTYKEEQGLKLGAFIKTDSLVSFLENQLNDLGLNQTEKTDFITFWGPRMQHSPYVFIQFLVDEAYTQNIAELKVTPKPDNMRRIYLLFTGYSQPQKMELKPQKFTKFERDGFTVVEWGGSEILNNLLNF